ncbi:MAG: molecular chaperone TorD family protein [Desulfobacterales bacterium]|nr:molecular chaperone TorD family protein [Desulfobacterales bacterium]
MTKNNLGDREARADIAGGRASVYDLLVGVFGHLPDEAFLARIEGEGLQSFLDSCSAIKGSGFKPGVDHIYRYRSLMKGRARDEILEELSVDRTGILRGTGHRDLRPPYEGLYKSKKNAGDFLLKIKRSYRKAGLAPDDSTKESPDFLCLELDFMKQLCLRERDEWLSQKETHETVAHQEEFLREHLGSWVGQFCREAAKHARTDFFRGFALILDAFIAKEMSFLRDLLESI